MGWVLSISQMSVGRVDGGAVDFFTDTHIVIFTGLLAQSTHRIVNDDQMICKCWG
jgi:hypothetical protein